MVNCEAQAYLQQNTDPAYIKKQITDRTFFKELYVSPKILLPIF